ncbi:MAG: ERF family protein [Opitutae bacterium]
MANRDLHKVLKAMAEDEIEPKTPGQHNNYVSLEQLQKHIKKKYKEVEVDHKQQTVDVLNQQTCEYLHTNYTIQTTFTVGGESIATQMSVQLRDPTNPQTHGTAQTYLRRYNILILSNMIITGDPDDTDGAVERYQEPVNPDYEIILAELISELNSTQTFKELGVAWSKKVRTKDYKELPNSYKDRAHAVKNQLKGGYDAAA